MPVRVRVLPRSHKCLQRLRRQRTSVRRFAPKGWQQGKTAPLWREIIKQTEMKEIVTSKLTGVVDINDVPSDQCIGVVHCDGDKGWVQPISFKSAEVRFFYLDRGVRLGNEWGLFYGCWDESLQKWLDNGNKAYLFDSEKQLFKWLSE